MSVDVNMPIEIIPEDIDATIMLAKIVVPLTILFVGYCIYICVKYPIQKEEPVPEPKINQKQKEYDREYKRGYNDARANPEDDIYVKCFENISEAYNHGYCIGYARCMRMAEFN